MEPGGLKNHLLFGDLYKKLGKQEAEKKSFVILEWMMAEKKCCSWLTLV